ncbi:hypothetical protein [Streptomyces sp. Ru72]|uniref:hypothetical protein n=1 Tax=Streptomyces sp. Ru72 TaxID=2080747 RepID=UPI0011B0EC4D|nr:hypothetical protein [Streptomyces sp. Ru72]
MGGGVDGDDVGAVGQEGAAGDGEVPVVVVGGGDSAGFDGDVEVAGGGVVGEDVGVLADLVGAGDAPAGQVDREQAGVAVAGDKRQLVGGGEG